MLRNDVNGDGTADADALAAGDKVEHYYYAGWRVIEETDAASTPHTLAQTVYGTQYIDEPVCRDRNTDAFFASGSSDSDCLDSGGSQRYFYHQDANFRVVMLTDESGAAVERYDYDAYGEPRIWAGISVSTAANETGSLLRVSRVGNPLMHQGLRRDDETGLHENRYRTLHSRLGRFMQRDPLGHAVSTNFLAYVEGAPLKFVDPFGLYPPGHHIVPQAVRDANSAGLSDEAFSVMKNTTTGVSTDPAHGWSAEHRDYNNAVEAELKKLIAEKQKLHGPNYKLTAEDAKEFIEKLQKMPKDSIIGKFLKDLAAFEAKHAKPAKKITGKIIRVTTALKLIGGLWFLVAIVEFADAASENGVGYAVIQSASPVSLEWIKEKQEKLTEEGQKLVDEYIKKHPWNHKGIKRNCKGIEDLVEEAGGIP